MRQLRPDEVLKFKRKRAMAKIRAINNKVLLLQVKYLNDGSWDIDTRNALTDILKKNGFVWIESSASRAIFEDESLERFQQIIHTSEYHDRIARCERIVDPGLGITLPGD